MDNKQLAELFNISPNLNYKKIQKIMETVNDILEQIDEDDSKYVKYKDEYKDENMDNEEIKKDKNTFSIKKMINDLKDYYEDFEIETKTLYGIIFSFSIIIITIIVFLCRKKNEVDNNKREKNRGENEVKENDINNKK